MNFDRPRTVEIPINNDEILILITGTYSGVELNIQSDNDFLIAIDAQTNKEYPSPVYLPNNTTRELKIATARLNKLCFIVSKITDGWLTVHFDRIPYEKIIT